MKTRILIALVVLIGGLWGTEAQITKLPQQTPSLNISSLRAKSIVFVVSNKTNKVSHLVLAGDFPMMKRAALTRYPNSRFYKGIIRGKYRTLKNGILPILNTEVSMYTNKPFFPGDMFFPGDNFFPGDQFILVGKKARVTSIKNGQLGLKRIRG